MLEFVYGIKLINTKRTKDVKAHEKEEQKDDGEEFEVENELP